MYLLTLASVYNELSTSPGWGGVGGLLSRSAEKRRSVKGVAVRDGYGAPCSVPTSVSIDACCHDDVLGIQ